MNPNKSGAGGMRRKPGFSMLNHIHATALDTSPARLAIGMFGKVVVEIEPAIEARGERLCVENDRPDECPSVIALPFQQLCPSCMAGGQGYSKIGDAMRTRQQPGQDGGVRSIRDRTGRKGLTESNAIGGQGIERGGFNLFVAVAVNMVSAKSINGDEKNVGRR